MVNKNNWYFSCSGHTLSLHAGLTTANQHEGSLLTVHIVCAYLKVTPTVTLCCFITVVLSVCIGMSIYTVN